MKVLIADDEGRLRDFIKRVLESDRNLTVAGLFAEGGVKIPETNKPTVVQEEMDDPFNTNDQPFQRADRAESSARGVAPTRGSNQCAVAISSRDRLGRCEATDRAVCQL